MNIEINNLKPGEYITMSIPYKQEHVTFENLTAKQAMVLFDLVQISQTCTIRSSAVLELSGNIKLDNKNTW